MLNLSWLEWCLCNFCSALGLSVYTEHFVAHFCDSVLNLLGFIFQRR